MTRRSGQPIEHDGPLQANEADRSAVAALASDVSGVDWVYEARLDSQIDAEFDADATGLTPQRFSLELARITHRLESLAALAEAAWGAALADKPHE